MNRKIIIVLWLAAALVLTSAFTGISAEEAEEFHARARAERKIIPAISNLRDYLEKSPGLPDDIRKLTTEALEKTESLLSAPTRTYDDSWTAYHKIMSEIYDELKRKKADESITKNIKTLARTSSVDGIIITVIGVSTVFAGLILLAGIFSLVPLALGMKKAGTATGSDKAAPSAPLTGEVISAIATAFYMHINVYQEEQKQTLTWDKRFRRFSPWNMSGRLSINQKNRQIY